MVVEFPLHKLTLGEVPLCCFETHGQLLLSSPRPAFSLQQPSLYITLCVVEKWAAVGEQAGSSVWKLDEVGGVWKGGKPSF